MSADDYIDGVLSGNKVFLSKALSLAESTLQSDMELKQAVLEGVLPKTGQAIRLGITGAPGVGKSTFIEALGLLLLKMGYQPAVLTVDPSSQRSQGSILGDKTRMEQLSRSEKAFIRPSAAGKSLGGVAHHTRESILLCEAAGFDVVIVETVGVGQSEVEVRNMVDYFMLLLLAGAGDELQGIKKGIVEMADSLVINKADGDNLQLALQAQTVYQNALHFLNPANSEWSPPVFTCSAKNNEGIDQIWANVETYIRQMKANGYLEYQRQQQRLLWMEDCIKQAISRYLGPNKSDASDIESLRKQVKQGNLLPGKAAEIVLQQLMG